MRRSLFFIFFGIAVCFCAMTSAAQAQATRTWVSGVGDDANPCSRTAPCKTFPGAYSKTAAGGEIDVIDPGGFGTITIGKAITIDGGGGVMASILASSTYGITINGGATDRIVLRNIWINGINQSSFPGTVGIIFNSGQALNVEHCIIVGMGQQGIRFQPSVQATLNVFDTNIDGSTNDGIIVSTPAAGAGNRITLSNVRVTNSGNNGLEVGANTRVIVMHSVFDYNGISIGDGIVANAGSASVDVNNSSMSNNGGSGLHVQNGAVIRVLSSTISENQAFGINTESGTINSGLNNNIQGNSSGSGTFTGPIPPQ
jgi:hypothetical protein